MKILVDENLPSKVKFDFGVEHHVMSVNDLGWKGMKNGALLSKAIENGFQIFITMDSSIQYQQNLINLPLIIFLIKAKNNKHQTIQPLVSKINEKIRGKIENGVYNIM
ncbi:MAG: DUF5615 family PIN-like protein [Ignavibacteriales bacterium]|nr:DUF5615 family PIN-like protein [Ignavibacteriales bacterium]